MTVLGPNQFFDINKFPPEPGITVLGISMPLINNRQSPQKCFEATTHLVSKIRESGVGATISYSDGLYMYSDEPANTLKVKHQKLIQEHKQGYLNLIKRNVNIIARAFCFVTWSQLLLECPNFDSQFNDLKARFQNDPRLRQLVTMDIESVGKEVSENSINYLLEETLLDYLIAKGRVRLQNDFVNDRQKWILNCYHGTPHRTHAYLHQVRFLDLEMPENPYQDGWYDLQAKKLYDFNRLDIDTFVFQSH